MDDEKWWIWTGLASAWAGLLWYVNRHIRKVDHLDDRIDHLEKTYVPRQEIRRDLLELRQDQQKDMEYLRSKLDAIYELQLKQVK